LQEMLFVLKMYFKKKMLKDIFLGQKAMLL